jgi:antitoxin YefM
MCDRISFGRSPIAFIWAISVHATALISKSANSEKMLYDQLSSIDKIFINMETITISQPQFDFAKLIADINQKHQPILIQETTGKAVLISEQEWNEIQETLYLQSIPGMVESIHLAAATPIEECIDLEDVDW